MDQGEEYEEQGSSARVEKDEEATTEKEEEEAVELTIIPTSTVPTRTRLAPLSSQERLVIPPTPRHRLRNPTKQDLPGFLFVNEVERGRKGESSANSSFVLPASF